MLEGSLASHPVRHVFCGGGNNGGDGCIVAGLAASAGFTVRLYALATPEDLSRDAAKALQFGIKYGVKPEPYLQDSCLIEGVVIDALLDIGMTGSVRGN